MFTAGSGAVPDASVENVGAAQTASFHVDVLPRTVARTLLGTVLVLALASVVGQVLLREAPGLPLVGGLAHALYVDSEQSLPTIFAVLLILAVALLLAGIALLHRRAGSGEQHYWTAAAALAVLLAMDEYLSLHEQLIDPMRALLGTADGGLLYYAWVVPGLIAVIVVAVLFAPFIRRLPGRFRNRALVSASLYLGGAVGMEMVSGALDSAAGGRMGYAYLAATTLEETLELLAVVLLAYALLDLLSGTYGRVQVTADMKRNRQQPAPQ